MDTLPAELLEHIFSSVNKKTDRLRLQLTCKSFSEIVQLLIWYQPVFKGNFIKFEELNQLASLNLPIRVLRCPQLPSTTKYVVEGTRKLGHDDAEIQEVVQFIQDNFQLDSFILDNRRHPPDHFITEALGLGGGG